MAFCVIRLNRRGVFVGAPGELFLVSRTLHRKNRGPTTGKGTWDRRKIASGGKGDVISRGRGGKKLSEGAGKLKITGQEKSVPKRSAPELGGKEKRTSRREPGTFPSVEKRGKKEVALKEDV